jgi:hypothetical protein
MVPLSRYIDPLLRGLAGKLIFAACRRSDL